MTEYSKYDEVVHEYMKGLFWAHGIYDSYFGYPRMSAWAATKSVKRRFPNLSECDILDELRSVWQGEYGNSSEWGEVINDRCCHLMHLIRDGADPDSFDDWTETGYEENDRYQPSYRPPVG